MFSNYNWRSGIPLIFNGLIGISETMVMIIDTHILTKNSSISYMDLIDGMYRAVIVEKNIVPNGNSTPQFGGQL